MNYEYSSRFEVHTERVGQISRANNAFIDFPSCVSLGIDPEGDEWITLEFQTLEPILMPRAAAGALAEAIRQVDQLRTDRETV